MTWLLTDVRTSCAGDTLKVAFHRVREHKCLGSRASSQRVLGCTHRTRIDGAECSQLEEVVPSSGTFAFALNENFRLVYSRRGQAWGVGDVAGRSGDGILAKGMEEGGTLGGRRGRWREVWRMCVGERTEKWLDCLEKCWR